MISANDLLKPLPDDNPVGINLRYEPLYDKIRIAREQDDPTLSQGIWERDLKKADWSLVEELCLQALSTETKDLQIAGWLVESWIGNEGFKGLSRGIEFLNKFSTIFKTKAHPLIDSKEDPEAHISVFDWLDRMLNTHLIGLALTKPQHEELPSYSLGNWQSALQFDLSSKRERNKGKDPRAAKEDQCTIEKFQASLTDTEKNYLKSVQESCKESLRKISEYKRTLEKIYPKTIFTFRETEESLNEIVHLIKTKASAVPAEGQVKEVTEPIQSSNSLKSSDTELSLKTRDEAYQLIGKVAKFLNNLEPHSPTPYMLERIATWNTKSLNGIFESITTDPQEFPLLLKFLGMNQPNKPST